MDEENRSLASRILGWIGKVFTDSFSKTISTFLGGIFTPAILIALYLFITNQYKVGLLSTIPIPIYLLLILSLFALTGVLVGVNGILKALDRLKKIDGKSLIKNVRIIEKGKREWRGVYHNDGFHWILYDEPSVYCSKHKLNLKLQMGSRDIGNGVTESYYFSSCPECEC
jgi:hypothetical protein